MYQTMSPLLIGSTQWICVLTFPAGCGPEKECICTPHLDIARFKYSLEVIKQYPQFKLLNFNWWNGEKKKKKFLETYCKEMKVKINKYDIALINYFMF